MMSVNLGHSYEHTENLRSSHALSEMWNQKAVKLEEACKQVAWMSAEIYGFLSQGLDRLPLHNYINLSWFCHNIRARRNNTENLKINLPTIHAELRYQNRSETDWRKKKIKILHTWVYTCFCEHVCVPNCSL